MKQLAVIVAITAFLLTGCKTGSDLVLPQGTGMAEINAPL